VNSRRVILIAVGVLFLLGGLVMAFQGAGYVGGSYMTGDPTWIYVGGVVAIIGLLLMVLGLRSGQRNQTPVAAAQ
jgi:uncharacterized membrane protein